MLSYALKRIVRSWKLFVSLILGMMLAATFFGGINVGADTIGKQALDAQLADTPVDMQLTPSTGFPQGSIPVPPETFQNVAAKVGQVDGVASVELFGSAPQQGPIFNPSFPTVKAIQDSSLLYKHLSVVNGQKTLEANESFVNADSPFGQNYTFGQTVGYSFGSYRHSYNVTLRIVGVAKLDTLASATLGVSSLVSNFRGTDIVQRPSSVLIVSWERTFLPLVRWEYNETIPPNNRGGYNIAATVNVYLDRSRLLSAFNIEGSIAQVQQIEAKVTNEAARYNFSSSESLTGPLASFSQSIFLLRFTFTIFSLPVFFVAWLVGRTVSQASFNLRRREIGLLKTKGFSNAQLFRHFMVEALIVGLVGGGLGLAAAVTLNPYFIQVLSGSNPGAVFLTSNTAIITIVFTVILTLLSIFSPARAAASMDPAKALREYVYLEDTRSSRKTGAILAFSLGLYKIILLTLGINFQNIGRFFFGTNFLLALVLIIMAVADFGLTFIGPFLFLYGATQLSTGLALRFHRGFASLSKRLVGDVATLASKNVFRNPRRVSAIVFLVALIAGYSIWVVGDQASQQDYNFRQAETQVGSDLRITGFNSLTNASMFASQLRSWSNITGATVEGATSLQLSRIQYLQMKAIDPLTWRQGAYYEDGWFTGNIDDIFRILALDNQTIVLDHGVASYYGISYVNISSTKALSVISLFGPDYSQRSLGGSFGVPGFGGFAPMGWSYVPIGLVVENPTIFSSTYSVLAKADSAIPLSNLASSIRKAYTSVSVDTAEVSTQGATGTISNGIQNVLRLGTVFAGLAACIGVGAVSYTGFKEREKETTMIAVRGLSYKQMLGLLVTEVLPLVIFALILATAVGLITVRGDALAQSTLNLSYTSMLAQRRVVFPLWATETILGTVGLLFAGVFLPAITSARKDLSRMSRTVRFA